MEQTVKERLTETAARLFAERGFSRVGINEIIREANVARMSLYNHFPSKEDLALAAYASISRQRHDDVEAAIDAAASPQDAILAIFDLAGTLASVASFRGCAFINLAAHLGSDDAALTDLVRQHKAKLRARFMRLAEQLAHTNAEVLGRQLLALWDGALADAYIENDVTPISTARSAAAYLIARDA